MRSAWCRCDTLLAAATEQAGLRQVIRLRRLIPYAGRRAESPMESRMRWRFIDGGLPAPDLHIAVRVGDRRRFLDTGWREQRVAAEFDGVVAHMTREQLREDRLRHNVLTEVGWTLLHFTGHGVYRGGEQMVERTARALGLPPRRRPSRRS